MALRQDRRRLRDKERSDEIRIGTARRVAGADPKPSREFDIRYRSAIEDTLQVCLASGRPAFVDLSEVTFMDSRCIQELAVHY